MVYDGKPWLKSYDSDVPENIEIPAISLKRYYVETFKQHQDRAAYQYLGSSLTFGELLERSGRLAKALNEHYDVEVNRMLLDIRKAVYVQVLFAAILLVIVHASLGRYVHAGVPFGIFVAFICWVAPVLLVARRREFKHAFTADAEEATAWATTTRGE